MDRAEPACLWRAVPQLAAVDGYLRWSDATDTRQRSITLMGCNAHWQSTDQIPQRAVDIGLIDRFGLADPTDGGRTKASQRVAPLG